MSMNYLIKPNIYHWVLFLGLLLLVGVVVYVVVGVILIGSERQDIIIKGSSNSIHYLDGNYVGAGESVCVPQVSQGKHTIEQRDSSGTKQIVARIYDVNVKIKGYSGSYFDGPVVLGNCSKGV